MLPLLLALAAPGAQPPALPSPPSGVPALPPTFCPTVPAMPTWDRMFVGGGGCAGPALQPFQRQPRVTPVAVCPGEPNGDGPKNYSWVKEFHTPAFVPYPRFDLDGRPVDGDGLVIYEGMRLAVDPKTGMYDLSFTATVPSMPVNLRLQLRLADDPLNPKQSYTLTLPPMRLQPPRDARPGDPAPLTFHVAHRGYSSLFLDPARRGIDGDRLGTPPGTGPIINQNWTVTRTGTARFGTPVAIDDPNR